MSSDLNPINQLQEVQENIDQIIKDFRADSHAANSRLNHLETVASYYQTYDSQASWLSYMKEQAKIAEHLERQASGHVSKLKNYILQKSKEWEENYSSGR